VAEQARYMYAISRGITSADLSGTLGIDDGPVEVVEHGGLCAAVSTVDLEEYGEEGLRRNLERLDWLEDVARAHDAVVQAVARAGPTAPLRLATICLDDDGVRRRLEEWHDALREVLDRVEGRREWSLKVFAPPRAHAPSAEQDEKPLSGADYLRRKKQATEERRSGDEAALRVAETLYESLASRTVASRRLAPQDPRLTGHEGTMLLNAAYLVETADEADFTAAVEDLAGSGSDLQVEVRGPWPPYSFAVLEQS
jgi:hypothetical protein